MTKEISSDNDQEPECGVYTKKRQAKEKKSKDFVFIEKEGYEERSSSQKELILLDVEEKKQYFKDQYSYELQDSTEVLLTIENCEIRNHDLIRLSPDTFLNDSMMNFFIKIITSHIYSKEAARNVHVFNTYFWLALEDLVLKINTEAKNRITIQQNLSRVYSSLLSKVQCI
jgi:Ulp1 family protease